MGVKFCLGLVKLFILLLVFFFINSALNDKVFAQSCTDWWPTVSSLPSCSQPLFQPDCNGGGATTGSQCCTGTSVRDGPYDYCENQTINQPALRYQFRCCNNAPPPPPSPTPGPSCTQTPGSFASYDGCISCGSDRINYYNCDGSTFSITYPNSECSYLCPLPPCDTGQVCGSCNLIASGNACSGNGTQSCVYTTSSSGGACSQVTTTQSCNVNNCSPGYICNNGSCVPTTTCPNGTCNAGESCSSCPTDCGSCPLPSPSPSQVPSASPNFCSAAGYVPCTPGQVVGSCMLGGLVCTSYATYACNFNGQDYCDPAASNCDIPCDNPLPSPSPCVGAGCGPPPSPSPGTCTFSDCGANSCGSDSRYVSGDTCSADYSWYTNPGCYSDTSCPGGGGGGSIKPADLVCRETVSKDNVNWSNSVTVNRGDPVYFKMQISNSGGGIPWYGTRNNFQEAIDGYTNIWQNSVDPLGSVFWLIRSADGISWDNNYYDSGGEFCPGCVDTTNWSEVIKSDAQTFKNAGYAAVSLYTAAGNYIFPGGCNPDTAPGNQCCFTEIESGGQTCISFAPSGGCNPSYREGCAYNGSFQCNKVTVNVVEPTVPISGYIRNFQTDEGIQGVVVQVYDNDLGATRSSAPSAQNGAWMVDKFVRPGDSYAVRIPGGAPAGYILPPKTSTMGWTWNFGINPNVGTNPWADTPWGSASYEGQKAGNWDCAGADGAGVTGRCNFVYDMDQVESTPPPPIPTPNTNPWIQTTGGDVHSNTNINTPGGP